MEVLFTMPTKDMVSEYLSSYWPDVSDKKEDFLDRFEGMSFSNIDRELTQQKRANVISSLTLRKLAGEQDVSYHEELSIEEKKAMAVKLHKQGLSQRAISMKLGISRPTVKKSIEDSQEG